MKKVFGPIFFIATLVAGLISISSCKKCIICTVKDTNSGHVLYISPEKCGKEEDFNQLKTYSDSFSCWGCAVYDTAIFDSIPDNFNEELRWDSAYVANLDSIGVDTLDSVNCGHETELLKLQYRTGALVRALYANDKYFIHCSRGNKFPTTKVCD